MLGLFEYLDSVARQSIQATWHSAAFWATGDRCSACMGLTGQFSGHASRTASSDNGLLPPPLPAYEWAVFLSRSRGLHQVAAGTVPCASQQPCPAPCVRPPSPCCSARDLAQIPPLYFILHNDVSQAIAVPRVMFLHSSHSYCIRTRRPPTADGPRGGVPGLVAIVSTLGPPRVTVSNVNSLPKERGALFQVPGARPPS